MPTLKHPRIPHVSVDVPDSDVEQWEASGWVNTEPAPVPGENGWTDLGWLDTGDDEQIEADDVL